MQGSYINRISKVIMKIVTILLVGLGVGTILITLIFAIIILPFTIYSYIAYFTTF